MLGQADQKMFSYLRTAGCSLIDCMSDIACSFEVVLLLHCCRTLPYASEVTRRFRLPTKLFEMQHQWRVPGIATMR